jgi:hypothetical protein
VAGGRKEAGEGVYRLHSEEEVRSGPSAHNNRCTEPGPIGPRSIGALAYVVDLMAEALLQAPAGDASPLGAALQNGRNYPANLCP